jgi:hypothetical protein
MFSALAGGAFLVVTGSIGWSVSRMHGFFEGGRWAGGPIWTQIVLGLGFLLLGVYWSRHLAEPDSPSARTPPARIVKNVGSGKTLRAAQQQERSNQPSQSVRGNS